MSNYPSYTVCPIKPVLPHKICQKSKIYSQVESIKENTHELSDGEDSHECLWNGLCNYTLRFIQINFVLQNIRSMNKTSSTLSIYNILMLLLRMWFMWTGTHPNILAASAPFHIKGDISVLTCNQLLSTSGMFFIILICMLSHDENSTHPPISTFAILCTDDWQINTNCHSIGNSYCPCHEIFPHYYCLCYQFHSNSLWS